MIGTLILEVLMFCFTKSMHKCLASAPAEENKKMSKRWAIYLDNISKILVELYFSTVCNINIWSFAAY